MEALQLSCEGLVILLDQQIQSYVAFPELLCIDLAHMSSPWTSHSHEGLGTGWWVSRQTGTPENIRGEVSSRTGFLSSNAVE